MAKRPATNGAITHLGQLTPDPANRRKRTQRNLGMIADSLQQVGAARSIVIDEDNVIIAGNGVWEAAGQVGIERVRVVDADGEEIIAVRRTGLSPEQKRHLGLYDNRAAELAEWDTDQLLADLNAGLSFDGLWDRSELDALLAGDWTQHTNPDKPPSLSELAGQYGDPEERAMWPWVKAQVHPATLAAYEALLGRLDGDDPAIKFARMVELADAAAP